MVFYAFWAGFTTSVKVPRILPLWRKLAAANLRSTRGEAKYPGGQKIWFTVKSFRQGQGGSGFSGAKMGETRGGQLPMGAQLGENRGGEQVCGAK